MIWRSGEEDGAIGQWLTEKEERRELEARLRDAQKAIDFDFNAYIEELITNNDLPQLRNEMEGIEERGGPRDDWERRVVAYFNQHAAPEPA